MKHVVFNFPFNEINLKAIDGDCLLALVFFFFLKPDEFKWGEQIILFIILTNLFFVRMSF